MSRVFSKVTSEDTIGQVWEFLARGFVQDEDDFLHTDFGADIFESASGYLSVETDVYCFGDGESESASDEDIKFIIDHEDDYEKLLQPDHLETFRFTIYPDEYIEED